MSSSVLGDAEHNALSLLSLALSHVVIKVVVSVVQAVGGVVSVVVIQVVRGEAVTLQCV